MPVVLSANRLEQPVSEAAVSISVIDRETIEASGARTIPEILRLVPGMQVGYSGNEFGDEPKYVVTYHGHSDQYSKQMQVLIDGRSIYQPFFGGINWKAIPVNIDDIERIEVSRGPNLATYGANSFMAAINIITRTAAEDQGSYVRSNIGNHDIRDLSYRYGGTSGDLDYRITASTLNDDGLDSINEYDNPDDTNSNNIDYRLDYQVDNNNTLSYQGGYGYNRQQADRNHESVIPTERTVNNTNVFQFIKWENAVNSSNTIQLQYYYNLSDKDDRYVSDLVDPGSGLDTFMIDVDAGIKSERHNLEFSHFTSPVQGLNLAWGLSSQFDFVTSTLYLGTDEKVSNEQYRAFANVEYQINHSNTLNLGALVENNSYSDSEISPRISLTHAFNPQHKIRLGISRAVRNPFIYEAVGQQTYRQPLTVGGAPIPNVLRENVIGSTDYREEDLKNETITSHEIVYMGEFLQNALMFNARLFYDEMDDYIDTLKETDNNFDLTKEIPFDNEVLVFRNPISSRTTGLELELDYSIDPTLRVIASGAVIYINSNSDAIEKSAPKQSFSTFLTKQFNQKYSGSLGYYYVKDFKWTDARGTDDYDILDLRLSRNFRYERSNGSVSVVLKNLFGSYADYNENPRNTTAPRIVQNTIAYLDLRLNF